jgi:hypothetical protein
MIENNPAEVTGFGIFSKETYASKDRRAII